MKKAKLFGYALMMGIFGAELLAASTLPCELASRQMIRLSEVSDRVMQDFSEGRRTDVVVECLAGTNLPFRLAVEGEFLGLDANLTEPLYLKVLKTCYVRCEERGHFLFSADLQDWREFSEFFTGEFKVSLEVEDGGPVASLQFELRQRGGC